MPKQCAGLECDHCILPGAAIPVDALLPPSFSQTSADVTSSFDVLKISVPASTRSWRIFTNIQRETTSPPRAVSLQKLQPLTATSQLPLWPSRRNRQWEGSDRVLHEDGAGCYQSLARIVMEPGVHIVRLEGATASTPILPPVQNRCLNRKERERGWWCHPSVAS